MALEDLALRQQIAVFRRSVIMTANREQLSPWALVAGAMVYLLCASSASAQTDDLIRREIDRALLRSYWVVGPFHLTPQLRTGGAYDSNVVLTRGSENSDVSLFTAPSVRAVVPLGNRALIELYEELNFIYFRELTQLRDVFNVTRVGGAFGGKQLVARIDDEFREEKVTPTREIEIPVDQRSNRLGASVGLSLGWRHELTLEFARYRVLIRDSDATVGGVPLKALLDRIENTAGLKLTRNISPDTSVFLETSFQQQTFDQKIVERDADGYAIYAGVVFSPTGNLRGQGRFGFKRVVPKLEARDKFAGLVGAGDVRIRLGRRFDLQVRYSREPVPSVVSTNLFVVTSQVGAFVDIHFGREMFLRPGIVFGSNNYPDSSADEEGVNELLIRRSRSVSLSFIRNLTPTWHTRTRVSYSNRQLNTEFSDADRLVLSFEITTAF